MLSVFFEGNLVEKLDMDLPPVSSRTEKVQALAPDYKISEEGMSFSYACILAVFRDGVKDAADSS